MPYLGTFELEFKKKNYSHFRNQHPRNGPAAKFCEIMKWLNLGPKIPHLGTFELEFLKNYCHI